jgi:hypothetical protein
MAVDSRERQIAEQIHQNEIATATTPQEERLALLDAASRPLPRGDKRQR